MHRDTPPRRGPAPGIIYNRTPRSAARSSREGAKRIVAIGLRLIGVIAGGYFVTALAVAAAGALFARLGMARAEAVVLAAMLGFLAYLVWLLWGFSVKSGTRFWLMLASGAAALASLLLLVR